ncbi:MAG: hypothetical protein ACLP9S_00020 [Syntrophales bacterium]|jgi:hypothetical protein
MTWVKDIINEHEKREADKIRFRQEADEQKERKKEELSKKWEEFVENVIHPVLDKVKTDLNDKSYHCTVEKIPYTEGGSGTKEIQLTTDMQKKSRGSSPNKASISFTQSKDGSISIVAEPLKIFEARSKTTMSLSDNQSILESKMREFLQKVYPK